jgi:hypothetical protein
MRLLARSALALMALLLASCATIPEIPFDLTANPVSTIGFLDPGMPPKANVVLTGTVGQSVAASGGLAGALIGSIIDESMRAARVKHFEEGTHSLNYVAHDRFIAAVTSALNAHGYTVKMIEAKRAKQDDWLASYPPAGDPPVDAYLDIALIDYGYLAAGIGNQPYRPFVDLKVKLVRASDGHVLMQDVIEYDPLGTPQKAVTIAPDPEFAFANADALYAAPQHAVDGLDRAFAQIADTLGNLLR